MPVGSWTPFQIRRQLRVPEWIRIFSVSQKMPVKAEVGRRCCMEGEADQNKDGAITVQEMQASLSDSVGKTAMSLNRTQQPQVAGDQSRVLVGR